MDTLARLRIKGAPDPGPGELVAEVGEVGGEPPQPIPAVVGNGAAACSCRDVMWASRMAKTAGSGGEREVRMARSVSSDERDGMAEGRPAAAAMGMGIAGEAMASGDDDGRTQRIGDDGEGGDTCPGDCSPGCNREAPPQCAVEAMVGAGGRTATSGRGATAAATVASSDPRWASHHEPYALLHAVHVGTRKTLPGRPMSPQLPPQQQPQLADDGGR